MQKEVNVLKLITISMCAILFTSILEGIMKLSEVPKNQIIVNVTLTNVL